MLMRDPLLRSARVLEALFYSYVIVCEADADRAFYQEINERLLASNDPRGIPNTLFLNANGKQTIPRIIEPLRKLGIPSAGIVDIDIVKDRGEEWTRCFAACGIPNSEYQPYGVRRASALDSLRSANCNFKTSGGVTLLSGSEREAADNLFDDLARYGLFVLREGEVEVWLAGLAVPRAKHLWLRSIFERMGSDPNSPGLCPTGAWRCLGFHARDTCLARRASNAVGVADRACRSASRLRTRARTGNRNRSSPFSA